MRRAALTWPRPRCLRRELRRPVRATRAPGCAAALSVSRTTGPSQPLRPGAGRLSGRWRHQAGAGDRREYEIELLELASAFGTLFLDEIAVLRQGLDAAPCRCRKAKRPPWQCGRSARRCSRAKRPAAQRGHAERGRREAPSLKQLSSSRARRADVRGRQAPRRFASSLSRMSSLSRTWRTCASTVRSLSTSRCQREALAERSPHWLGPSLLSG